MHHSMDTLHASQHGYTPCITAWIHSLHHSMDTLPASQHSLSTDGDTYSLRRRLVEAHVAGEEKKRSQTQFCHIVKDICQCTYYCTPPVTPQCSAARCNNNSNSNNNNKTTTTTTTTITTTCWRLRCWLLHAAVFYQVFPIVYCFDPHVRITVVFLHLTFFLLFLLSLFRISSVVIFRQELDR